MAAALLALLLLQVNVVFLVIMAGLAVSSSGSHRTSDE